MKIIHKIGKVLLPEKIELTSIDGTAFDLLQRRRHYEKRAGEIGKLIPTLLQEHLEPGKLVEVKIEIIEGE